MDSSADMPGPELCVQQWFERQAARTPDAVAVNCGVECLTYQELSARSSQLARHLRRLGVVPETKVGICLERSVEMITGLLGILKAGGAYVPLDFAYPRERTEFMIADANLKLVLTEEKFREQLSGHAPGAAAPALLCLDSDWPAVARESAETFDGGAKPENLAYVIYTSGSTGKPKGVLVTHHNVARLFATTQPWFGFGPTDVWTFFHSHAFDFSVWEIWGALIYGGRLVVVPYALSRSPAAFYELLGQEKVTVLNQTPSAFRQLIWAESRAGQSRELNLKWVIFGGEALELQSLRPWFERHGDARPKLVNMYGITETTVHVTYRPLSLTDLDAKRGSVIGVPLPDLEILLLDENKQPVAAGIAGEIHVRGAGLARGYLNRPELTAERFIPNPFATGSADRLYKTGDLARRLSDGDLEYLGRCDHQVKIRGFRIELGEVESALNRHPAIRESVVIAGADGSGDQRLVAYLTLKIPAEPAVHELREWLKNHLPEYMIPAAFVVLPELPLTPNGKVDRNALPMPDNSTPSAAAGPPPETEMEMRLAAIWRETLGIPQAGRDDNFFDLGGNSLQLARVHALIGERLGVSLEITRLFEFTTIKALAAYLGGGESERDAGQFADRARRQRQNLAGQRMRRQVK